MKEQNEYYLVELYGTCTYTARLVKARNKKEAKAKFLSHFTDPNESKPSYAGEVIKSSQVIVNDTIE